MKQIHKRIGVIFLPTDCTGPSEFHTIAKYFNGLIIQSVNCRFPKDVQELNRNTYEFALNFLPETVDCLRPIGTFNCIGVSCTSFCFTVGSNRIIDSIKSVHPDTTITDMKTSLFKAIRTMSITNLLVLTAYKSEFNYNFKLQLESEDFKVIGIQGFGLDTDYEIYNVSKQQILHSILDLISNYSVNNQNKDTGIVISCSALNMLEPGFIDLLEYKSGLPIISSMQAFCWNMLRLSSIHEPIDGFGTLFSNY